MEVKMRAVLGMVVIALAAFESACGDPGILGPDTRKTRHPANGPTTYNTISVADGEALSKLQNQVAPTVQIPLKPVNSPSGAVKLVDGPPSVDSSAPPSIPSPYLRQPSVGPVSSSQYYVVSPQASANQMMTPATPLIMQYINPQGQPIGGLQYIQLLRPYVYPYASPQYAQPGYLPTAHAGGLPSPVTPSVGPAAHYTAPPTSAPVSPSTAQPNFVPFQPSAIQQQVAQYAAGHIHQGAPTYNGPVGQYSSPVLSYYPQRFLFNPSSEMNFNTNEYMPPPGDSVYIKGVKSIRA